MMERVASIASADGTVEPRPDDSVDDFPIVGVGASAGGLAAFTQLLEHLPADSGMAFVLIQHLDPTHTSLLCEALAKATTMAISQPEDGTPVEPNRVYVIPPDADITIRSGLLALSPRARDEQRPHLPIDLFFRSLAADRGSHAIGVVLSGNASDGTEGLRAIKAENGITLAQDPGSAKYSEMPRSAVDAGVVDRALSLEDLAHELVRLGQHPYWAAGAASPPPRSDDDATALSRILALVRSAVGVDFTAYKRPTFERRLARRMALRRAGGPEDYLALLEQDSDEVRALYEDVLIHVTSFFRDPEVFTALEAEILPAIIRQKPPGAPIRIWVAGCSTGEEVYSIGISLLEVLGDSPNPIQIFGSDLSEAIIGKARAGIYPEGALRQVSDERRKRYFLKTDRGYRVHKMVRDLCVFVQHDLASDAPFSKLDLVSCRNVLIYFDSNLQKQILPSFHYALNQPGYLLLGRTESISGFGRWFSTVDKGNKIFARTEVPSTLRVAPRWAGRPAQRQAVETASPVHAQRTMDLGRYLDRVLLSRYAPPGVLINQKMEVLQFRGQTGAYLQPAPGEPQNDIIKMARPGLVSTLRATIAQAQKEMTPVARAGVEVDQDGFARTCNLVVFPFTGPPDVKEPLFVVLFEEAPLLPAPGAAAGPHVNRRRRSDWIDDDRRIPKVEHELMATKEYLQSLIEEHGRTNDELGSANAELVSGNEELQSMNEELETAKEELQSTNEELTTVNDELQSRNQEVTQANSDLLNLLVTVDIPIIILDLERRIRRFTPKATSILNVLPSDTGRPIDNIKPNIDVVDLDRQIAEVIETMEVKESEVRDRDGHWYRMQIRPYKTTDNRIDGAILSLVDIDALKHLVCSAQEARSEAEHANRAKDLFLAVLGHELRTPLTALLLQSQMLRRNGAMDATKVHRVGERIERATRTQMHLVEDLLDVSRIVAGKLKLSMGSVDLAAVVRAALEGVGDAAAAKSIGLEVSLDESLGTVAGDPVRLQQVVSNLLTNALTFTPEHGRVAITLDATNDHARIQVSDTGVGIEAAFLPQVFNRFSQEDTSNTRPHGGLGLGLAIVRYLVEQHSGTVEAQSPGVGRGSTFSVVLPLVKIAQKVASDGANELAARTTAVKEISVRMKDLPVLVVDDDLATREAVAEMLNGMGARVWTAGSSAEALTAVRAYRPKIVLCDIAMPGEDGYTFVRQLRTLGRHMGGETPALALTALATEDDVQRSLAAGFQMHVTKPVDILRLSDAVLALVQAPLAC